MSDTRGRGRTSSDAGKPMIGIYDFSYGPYALGDGDVRRLPLRLTGEPRMLLPAEVERLLRATWFAFPRSALASAAGSSGCCISTWFLRS